MIHQIVFAQMNTAQPLYKGGEGFGAVVQKTVNSWELVRNVMQHTSDHIIWVVTTEQLSSFLDILKKYKLNQYLVVAHSGENEGTTNRNYPDRPRRLKVFVMKGAK